MADLILRERLGASGRILTNVWLNLIEGGVVDEEDRESRLREYRDRFGPLGKDRAVAFIKNQMGVTFATAEKHHKHEETSMYWLILAELITYTAYNERNQIEMIKLVAKFRHSREGSEGNWIDLGDRKLD